MFTSSAFFLLGMTPLEYIEDSEPVDGSRNQWRAVQ